MHFLEGPNDNKSALGGQLMYIVYREFKICILIQRYTFLLKIPFPKTENHYAYDFTEH